MAFSDALVRFMWVSRFDDVGVDFGLAWRVALWCLLVGGLTDCFVLM